MWVGVAGFYSLITNKQQHCNETCCHFKMNMYGIKHLKNANKFPSATILKLRIRSKSRGSSKSLSEGARALPRVVLNARQNAAKPVFAQTPCDLICWNNSFSSSGYRSLPSHTTFQLTVQLCIQGSFPRHLNPSFSSRLVPSLWLVQTEALALQTGPSTNQATSTKQEFSPQV